MELILDTSRSYRRIYLSLGMCLVQSLAQRDPSLHQPQCTAWTWVCGGEKETYSWTKTCGDTGRNRSLQEGRFWLGGDTGQPSGVLKEFCLDRGGDRTEVRC